LPQDVHKSRVTKTKNMQSQPVAMENGSRPQLSPGAGGAAHVRSTLLQPPSTMTTTGPAGPTGRGPPASAGPPRPRVPPSELKLANRSSRVNRIVKQPHGRKQKRHGAPLPSAEVVDLQGMKFEAERELPSIKALTPRQAEYLDALRRHEQVIVLGPAGTGKTW